MLNPATPPKAAPYEMTSTQVKSNMMDMLDDARAGYVSYITRGGRPTAAVVPVAVGRAYETQAALPDHIRTEIAEAVDRARAEITPTDDGATAAPVADRQLDPTGGTDE